MIELSRRLCAAAGCSIALASLVWVMSGHHTAEAGSIPARTESGAHTHPQVAAVAPSIAFTPTAVARGGTLSVSGSAFSTGAVTATVGLVAAEPPTATVATLGAAPLSAGSFGPVSMTVPITVPVGTYRVRATDGVVTATSASTLTIMTLPSRLVFTSQPRRAAHGFAFGLQPVVAIQDAVGNTLADDSSTVVTLAIKGGTGTSGATLACDQTAGGVTRMTVAAGIGAFTGCLIDQPGVGYVLEAAAAGIASGQTVAFNVTWAGDTKGDCRVSILDYSAVVTHFGKSSGSPDWADEATRPWRADINGDEQVDVLDHSMVVTRFGASTANCPAPTATTIAIGVVEPAARALVGDSVAVRVVVGSRYQVQSVRARVGERAMALAFSSAGICAEPSAYPSPLCPPGWAGRAVSSWAGTVSLAGLAWGEHEVAVTAADVFSGTAQGRTTVRHDLPPTLTVLAPLAESVARPQLRVTASCADDDPAGCAALRLVVPDQSGGCPSPGAVLATGRASLDTSVSLAAYDGRAITVCLVAQDSAGQGRSEGRAIFVESSARLREVDTVGGPIWDVQPDRILYLDSANLLRIRNRVSAQETVVLTDTTLVPQQAFLTPRGAMLIARRGETYTVYDWREGQLVDLGPVSRYGGLRVRGNYAVWVNPSPYPPPLLRRDLVAGANVEITRGEPDYSGGGYATVWQADVAANGDVIYLVGSLDYGYGLFLYHEGAIRGITRLNAPFADITAPGTDGVNAAYVIVDRSGVGPFNYTIVLSTVSGTVTSGPFRLDTNQLPGGSARNLYQLSNGWAAFHRPGTAGEVQVWLRSPAGQESQVSYFSTSSSVDALAPDGQVMFLNGGRRYLSGPSTTAVDVGSSLGRSFRQDGQWLVAIGRSLFQIVP